MPIDATDTTDTTEPTPAKEIAPAQNAADGGRAAAPDAGKTEANSITLGGKGEAAPAAGGSTPAPAGVTLDGKDTTGADGKSEKDGQGQKDGAGDAAYTYAYPEGFPPNPEMEAALTAFAKEHNLPPEKAQALADMHVKTLHSMNTRLTEEMSATKAKWAEEIRADPEFGGGNLKRTAAEANRALRHFAPELIDLLPQWNLEANPALIRAFARVGRTLAEGRSPRAEGAASERALDPILADKEKILAAPVGTQF